MDNQYIDREAAKRELLSWAININHPEYLMREDALHVIDSIPAADVAPVVHGRWELVAHNGAYEPGCTECGYFPGIKFWSSPYCPNCGAKMDGEEGDDNA